MTRKIFLWFMGSLLVSACTQSHGVNIMGPDTYSVSASAWSEVGGPASAKSRALSEAKIHCENMGKELLVTNTSSMATSYEGDGSADVTFQCLNRDDPLLIRPRYEDAPNNIIEHRIR